MVISFSSRPPGVIKAKRPSGADVPSLHCGAGEQEQARTKTHHEAYMLQLSKRREP